MEPDEDEGLEPDDYFPDEPSDQVAAAVLEGLSLVASAVERGFEQLSNALVGSLALQRLEELEMPEEFDAAPTPTPIELMSEEEREAKLEEIRTAAAEQRRSRRSAKESVSADDLPAPGASG